MISYDARDFNEEGTRYLEVYKDKERTALFVPASDYQAISGYETAIEPGTYQTVTVTDYREAFDYVDGLKEVMNPDTGNPGSWLSQGSWSAMPGFHERTLCLCSL